MPMPLLLPTGQFAVWAREHGVRLPYPLDISEVSGAGQRQPDAAPQLARLAQVAGDPRVAVFRLRLCPATGTSDCAVAVADDMVGAYVRMSPDEVEIRPVPAAELVLTLGNTMPGLAPLPAETTTLTEQRWNAILAAVARSDAATVLDADDIPPALARALLTPPRSIGTLGALTWTGGGSQLGTLMASWFEYPGGTVLARLEPPRHPGGKRSVEVQPYSPGAAARALTSIVTHALRASRR